MFHCSPLSFYCRSNQSKVPHLQIHSSLTIFSAMPLYEKQPTQLVLKHDCSVTILSISRHFPDKKLLFLVVPFCAFNDHLKIKIVKLAQFKMVYSLFLKTINFSVIIRISNLKWLAIYSNVLKV